MPHYYLDVCNLDWAMGSAGLRFSRAGNHARIVEAANLAFGHSQNLGQDGIGILAKARRRPGWDARGTTTTTITAGQR